MDPAEEFERCIGAIALRAARTAHRASDTKGELPPLPSRYEHIADSPGRELEVALGLTPDESEFVWSVVARAVDPAIAANARLVFGADARFGISLAHHVAWHELEPSRSRALLAVLDVRHRLRTTGILVAVGDEPYDILTPWTTSPRACGYLRGIEDLDPTIAALGGLLQVGNARHSPDQRRVLHRLRGWLGASSPVTIVLEGSTGSGRRTATAMAAAPRRTVAVDFSRVSPRRAEAVLMALRREAVLLDAVPIAANLDELWGLLENEDETRKGLANALDAVSGPLVITTSTSSVDLRAVGRMVLHARWPLPDASTRRALWIEALGETPADTDLDLIAHRYELGAGGISAAARAAAHRAEPATGVPQLTDLVAGIQDNIAEKLGELAKRVEVTQTWSELVLPAETSDDVNLLIGRIGMHMQCSMAGAFAKSLRAARGSLRCSRDRRAPARRWLQG